MNHRTNDADPLSATVNVKDCGGHTILHVAVAEAWMPGVCIALEAGADVTLKVNIIIFKYVKKNSKFY